MYAIDSASKIAHDEHRKGKDGCESDRLGVAWER